MVIRLINMKINMKKKTLLLICAIAIVIIAIIAACVVVGNNIANNSRARDIAFAPELIEFSNGLYEYNVEAAVDIAALTAKQSILIDSLDLPDNTIVLRTYPNAYASIDTSPAALMDMTGYPDGFSIGGVDIRSVYVNDCPAEFSYHDEAKTVLLVSPQEDILASGAAITLTLEYTVTIPNCAYRFGAAGDIIMLDRVFPTIAPIIEGQWRAEAVDMVGSPDIIDPSNWSVRLTVPDGWVAVTTGISDDGAYDAFESKATRGFSIVLLKGYKSSVSDVDGVAVTAYGKSSGDVSALLKAAIKSIELYNKLYGTYPYPEMKLIAADYPTDGAAFPQLSVINRQVDKTAFSRNISKITARQWFQELVGASETSDPWLVESLSAYAGLLYIESAEGAKTLDAHIVENLEPAFQVTLPRGITIGSPQFLFGGWGEYRVMLSERGALMLKGASDAIGADTFNQAIRAYIEGNLFGVATRDDFIKSVNGETSNDWSGYFEDYLDTLV
ncbi:hypothetical protein FACS18948_0210 [Clostridia bacterium]|nr:hypothetical protein FACS18948_0210 [Clostridia bacterium]